MGGKRLVLDRKQLIALVGDSEFYVQCPELAWLRETASAALHLYAESEKKRCCGGDWEIIRPVIDALYHELSGNGSKAAVTKSVRRFLEARNGSPFTQVMIYYRTSKQQAHPYKFTF